MRSPLSTTLKALILEGDSESPCSLNGLLDSAGEAGVDLVEPKDFSEIAGKGVKAQVNGQSVLVGRQV